MTATYSPEDDKLRLYPIFRLDDETYNRVKSVGFSWAPKQKLFYATWTTAREDLLIELCGEIGDEDTSLVERAEARAERFEAYSEKRTEDAIRAKQAVDALADNIPLGQPILVGHHSEKHARRDAEKIENGMRRAVRLWDTAEYWKDRAAGALHAAKYKELPAVRARRIKKIATDKRKDQRKLEELSQKLQFWSRENITEKDALAFCNCVDHAGVTIDGTEYYSGYDAMQKGVSIEKIREARLPSIRRAIVRYERWVQHYNNRLAYENAMLGESGGLIAERFDLKPGGQVLIGNEFLTVIRVNKSGGVPVSVTTNARYVRVRGIEEIKDYRPPTDDIAEAVKQATKRPPLCNYPGEGFTQITQAEWDKTNKDYKMTRIIKANDQYGEHRVRKMIMPGYELATVFITDAKRKDPPPPNDQAPVVLPREKVIQAPVEHHEAPKSAFDVDAMRETLRDGVKVVNAPQLFPTPSHIAQRMVYLAKIEHNHAVLEPSAGTGNILKAISEHSNCDNVVAVEINQSLATAFDHERYEVVCGDFLEYTGHQFDRIVMNPPFEHGADIKHINHAMTLLKPGGRLVALCADGPRQRKEFTPIAVHWESLPDGSFASQGTGVNVALMVITKG
jgi:protein-L-isoaspartate O-methyltransferase